MKKYALAGLVIGLTLLPGVADASSAKSKAGGKDRTPPKVLTSHIQSGGPDSTVARPGDTVTITFTTSEAVRAPLVLVETKTLFVRATQSGDNSWEASYTVHERDREGRVDYLITVADMAGNVYACASQRLFIIPQCPGDGSRVSVTRAPIVVADTTPPALTLPAPITVSATSAAGATVAYAASALDETDGPLTPACAPAPGSLFPVGATTVNCTVADTAGNSVSGSFAVTVEPYVPQPVVIASQTDESNLCTPSWEACFTGGGFEATINLGQTQSGAVIKSVTIARDPSVGEILRDYPWYIYLKCYADAAYTTLCSDWIVPTPPGQAVHTLGEPADASEDLKYWTADFVSGYTFRPEYYYRLIISDNGADVGAFGSATEPYWVLVGSQ